MHRIYVLHALRDGRAEDAWQAGLKAIADNSKHIDWLTEAAREAILHADEEGLVAVKKLEQEAHRAGRFAPRSRFGAYLSATPIDWGYVANVAVNYNLDNGVRLLLKHDCFRPQWDDRDVVPTGASTTSAYCWQAVCEHLLKHRHPLPFTVANHVQYNNFANPEILQWLARVTIENNGVKAAAENETESNLNFISTSPSEESVA